MAIIQSTTLSNSIRTRYEADYLKGVAAMRVYDMLSTPVGRDMVALARGSSVQVNYLGALAPATAAISETVDVTPVTMRDATDSISPTSRINAIQFAEKMLLQAYTNLGAERFEKVGENMTESVDLLASAAATQGGIVRRNGGTTRVLLDAGTAADNLSDALFDESLTLMEALHSPEFPEELGGGLAAIMHPYAYHDLRRGGNIVSIAQYQNPGIILNRELGMYGSARIISTPWAKAFWATGAANGTAVQTTIDANANALAKTISVASATNITVGDTFLLGTQETGNTHYPTNEYCTVTGVSGTTITIAAFGENGGLRYDHTSGQAVSNDDSTFPVVFGGPKALVKVFDPTIGEFGTVVGPTKQGLAETFESIAWKWYGNYGRFSETNLMRIEVSSSIEA